MEVIAGASTITTLFRTCIGIGSREQDLLEEARIISVMSGTKTPTGTNESNAGTSATGSEQDSACKGSRSSCLLLSVTLLRKNDEN
jgi:hypothetical protein